MSWRTRRGDLRIALFVFGGMHTRRAFSSFAADAPVDAMMSLVCEPDRKSP